MTTSPSGSPVTTASHSDNHLWFTNGSGGVPLDPAASILPISTSVSGGSASSSKPPSRNQQTKWQFGGDRSDPDHDGMVLTEDRGKSLLHIAAERGHVEIISILLAGINDIDERDDSGATALHYAVRNQCNSALELLLKEGANVNAVDDLGRSAIQDAVEGGFTEGVRLLSFYGANLKLRIRSNSFSAPHFTD